MRFVMVPNFIAICLLARGHNQPAFLLDRERDQNIEATARSVIEANRVILRLVCQSDKRAVEILAGFRRRFMQPTGNPVSSS
jgi:hypothetical protein